MSEVAQPTAQPAPESGAGNAAQPGTESGTPVAPAAAPAAGNDWESRFNGLMSARNAEKAAWEAEKAQLLARASQPAPAAEPTPTPQPVTPGTVTREEFEALQSQLLEQKLEAAKEAAVKAFPALAPLQDLLVAETPQDLMDLAQELNSRLNPAPAAAATTEETPAEPAVPVLASSTTYTPVTDDSIAALKADVKNNVPGAFGRLLNAYAAKQQQQQ